MKSFILSCLIVTTALTAQAQTLPLSAGFLIGGANYLGEIGGKLDPRASLLDVHMLATSPTLGAFLRYDVNHKLRVCANINYVHIRQADKFAENPARQARNLNFRNRMVEFGFRTDFKVLHLSDRKSNSNFTRPGSFSFDAFVFTGLYGVMHNPQAEITYDPNNEWENRFYDLRPLRTEGQVEEYGSFIASIPFGLGLEFGIRNGWKIGIEGSWRHTFTDYLDDLSGMYADPDLLTPLAQAISSQSNEEVIAAIGDGTSGSVLDHQYSEEGTKRGNPNSKDSYGTVQFTFAKSISTRTSFERALDHISKRR